MKIDGDDLTETLPPIDDDEADEAKGDDEAEDIDELPDQDGDSDDQEAKDDVDGDDSLDAPVGGAGDGEDDFEQTDVGDLDVDFGQPDIGDPIEADTTGPGEPDPALDDQPASEDDAGVEGTTEPIDLMVDGDLPALDADDEGDFEDTLLRETGLIENPRDGCPVRLTDETWRERADLFRPTPLVGRPLGIVDAIAVDPRSPEIVVGATLDKRLFVSADGGMTAAGSDGWRDPAAFDAVLDDAPVAIALSGLRGVILVACGTRLAQSPDLGATWHDAAGPRGSVAAMSVCADGTLAALAVDSCESWLCTSVDGSTWSARAIALPPAYCTAAGRVWLACAGAAVAVGSADGVWVSRDGGRTFDRVPGCAFAGAGVFAGEDTAAPLVVAVTEEPGKRSLLFRIGLDGTRRVVGRACGGTDSMDEDDEEAPAPGALFALVWDGARVWGAGLLGIAAWEKGPEAGIGRGAER
jgi:photosystem II stability/assembly factor-like uncharacterized protein